MTDPLRHYINACLGPYRGVGAQPGIQIYLREPGDVTDLGINGMIRQLELLRAQDEPFLYTGFYLHSDRDVAAKLGRERYGTYPYWPGTWWEWEVFTLPFEDFPGLDQVHLLPSLVAPASLSWLILTEDEYVRLCRAPDLTPTGVVHDNAIGR